MKIAGLKIKGNLILNLLLISFFATIIIIALGYPARARLGPMVIALPGLALSIAVFLQEALKDFRMVKQNGKNVAEIAATQETPCEEEIKIQTQMKRVITMYIWIVVVLLLILIFGFSVGIALFLPLFLRLHGHETWKITLLYTICGWLAVYGLFSAALKMSLFKGFLFEFISRFA